MRSTSIQDLKGRGAYREQRVGNKVGRDLGRVPRKGHRFVVAVEALAKQADARRPRGSEYQDLGSDHCHESDWPLMDEVVQVKS